MQLPNKNVYSSAVTRVTQFFIVLLSSLLLLVAVLTVYPEMMLHDSVRPIVIKIDPNIGVHLVVKEFFAANDAEAMIPIIECESRFRHFERDGSILKNREGSSAIGVAQIMSSLHPDPKVLQVFNTRFNTDLRVTDFDITTLDGNLGYALVLYKVRGTQDWECAHTV